MTTRRQRERQKHRDRNGRYAEANPCCACGRSAGIEPLGHPLTDCEGSDGRGWDDIAIVLCPQCYEDTKRMTTRLEFEAYRQMQASPSGRAGR
jgi:hypothetical protein